MSRIAQNHAIDYSRLGQLLAEKQWKQADEETRSLMCRVAEREAVPHLTPEAVQKLPCDALHSLDLLWATNSHGRFGFRVQRRLWFESGGIGVVLNFETMGQSGKEALADAERKFVRRVGWQDARIWTGAASNLPIGYLPYSCLMCSYGLGLVGLVASALAWRLGDCGLNA